MIRKIKKLVNFHESETRELINEFLTNHNAKLHLKIRIADVLSIDNSSISDELYSYALKGHFDFVLCEMDIPILAIEFDGPGHQTKNDMKKNQLCELWELPMYRISKHDWVKVPSIDKSLVFYICEVFMIYRDFRDAQKKGHISYEEPFIIESFLRIPYFKGKYPLSLKNKLSNLLIKKLPKPYFSKTHLLLKYIGEGKSGYEDKFIGIIYLPINENEGLITITITKSYGGKNLSELNFELGNELTYQSILSIFENTENLKNLDLLKKSEIENLIRKTINNFNKVNLVTLLSGYSTVDDNVNLYLRELDNT